MRTIPGYIIIIPKLIVSTIIEYIVVYTLLVSTIPVCIIVLILVVLRSGTYTAPVTGYYNICAFLRFKRGGNAVDVTVVAVGIDLVTLCTPCNTCRGVPLWQGLEMLWMVTGGPQGPVLSG